MMDENCIKSESEIKKNTTFSLQTHMLVSIRKERKLLPDTQEFFGIKKNFRLVKLFSKMKIFLFLICVSLLNWQLCLHYYLCTICTICMICIFLHFFGMCGLWKYQILAHVGKKGNLLPWTLEVFLDRDETGEGCGSLRPELWPISSALRIKKKCSYKY